MNADAKQSTGFKPSPALEEALEFSTRLSVWIGEHTIAVPYQGRTQQLALTHLAIALDHREGMLLLMRHGAFTPAFALIRPIYEALIRGSWAYLCASADECERAYNRGVLPKFETIIKQLDKKNGSDGEFGKSKSKAWEPYSDFAHGGMRQVIRWTGDGVIAPQHDDVDTVDLLAITDMHGLQASMTMSLIAGKEVDDFAEVANLLLKRHRIRKNKDDLGQSDPD